MQVRSVGIITNSATSQGSVNDDHAADIARAVEALGYKAKSYDLVKARDLERLVKDRRADKLDLVFNNSAGRRGGDGSIEGFFEVHDIPYVGSDVLATAVAFDKKTTKAVVAAHGVQTARGLAFSREQFDTKCDWVLDEIEYGLKFPVVVKASQGSDSIGVSLVKSRETLAPALKVAFGEDDQVVVEDFVKRLAEVTCMVLGNGDEARALKPVERVFEGDIYSINLPSRTYRIPTHLEPQTLKALERHTLAAHRAVDCSDYSRSDFIITKRGDIFFLELNAHAGLGNVGPTVFTAKATYGWNHQQLIGEIISIARTRYEAAGR